MLESPDMDPRTKTDLNLYLASNSPRRKALMSLIGLDFVSLPANVDETPLPNEEGIVYVKRIAKSKAAGVARQDGVEGVIIAADTAVIDHSNRGKAEILGKPRDQSEAVEMLRSLRGHTHQVSTAITIRKTQDGTTLSDLCTTDVPMRNYDDEEIHTYVASGDPMDKAGAYAIQNPDFHPVKKLSGCFANVMGLPLCHLARSLYQLDLKPAKNVPQACQAALGYDCPVYGVILKEKAPALILDLSIT